MTQERVDIVVNERGTGTAKIARGFKDIGDSAGKAIKPVSQINRLVSGAAIAAGTAVVVKTLRDYTQEMSTVAAITQAGTAELRQLDATARSLGSSTRFSASEAAEGMAFLARAGFETSEVLASIEGTLQLAQAGALELGSAADIASNVLSGFNLEASQTGRVVDVLALAANSANTDVRQLGEGMKFVAPVATALGVTLEEATAAIGELSNNGLQAGLAGRGLRSTLSALEAPSTAARDVLRELGLTAADVSVSSNGLSGALEKLSDAAISPEQSFRLFGKEAGSAFLILSKGKDNVNELTDSLLDADGTAKRVADTMDDNLNGAALSLRSAVEGLVLQLGELGITAALTTLTKGLAGGVRLLTTALGQAEPLINAVGVALALMASRAILANITTLVSSVGLLKGALVSLSIVAAANPLIFIASAAAALITVLHNLNDATKAVDRATDSYASTMRTTQPLVDKFRGATEEATKALLKQNEAQLILEKLSLEKTLADSTKAFEKQKDAITETQNAFQKLLTFSEKEGGFATKIEGDVKTTVDAFKKGEISISEYIVQLEKLSTNDRFEGGGAAGKLLEKIQEFNPTGTLANIASIENALFDVTTLLAGGTIEAPEIEGGDDALGAAIDKLTSFQSKATNSTKSELASTIADIETTRDSIKEALTKAGATADRLKEADVAAAKLISAARAAAKPDVKEDDSAAKRISGVTKALQDNLTVLSQSAGLEQEITRNLISAGLDAKDRTSEQALAIVELTTSINEKVEAQKEEKKETDKLAKTYADYRSEIDQQLALLGVESSVRESVSQAISIENELRRTGITLTAEERNALAEKLQILSDAQELDQVEIALKERLTESTRDLGLEVQALNQLYQDGLIESENYTNQLELLGLQAINAQIAIGEGGFADGFISELGRMSVSTENFKVKAGKAFGEFYSSVSQGAGDAFGRAIVFGDNLGKALGNVAKEALASLISGFVQMGIQMLINAAIGQALTTAAVAASTAQAAGLAAAWAPAAAFASLATLGTNAAPAAAGIASTVALSSGLASIGGFKDGGFVEGPGGPRDDKIPAWLSNQEFVVNAAATASYRPWLEAINSGMDPSTALGSLSQRGTETQSFAGVGSSTSIQMPITLTYAPSGKQTDGQDEEFFAKFRDQIDGALSDIVTSKIVEAKEPGGVLS